MKIHRMYRSAYAPATKWPFLAESVLRLPSAYDFDLERLKAQIDAIRAQVGSYVLEKPEGREEYRGYRGFGLTHREGSRNPDRDAFRLYDENGNYESSTNAFGDHKAILARESVHRFERNFTEKSPWLSGYIESVLGKFRSTITKVRVLTLEPGGEIVRHFDFPYYENVRVHAVLETNDQVVWKVEDREFHLPADGSFHWFDTGRYHSVVNRGETPRTVLCVHLSVYKDRDGRELYGPERGLVDLIGEGLL